MNEVDEYLDFIRDEVKALKENNFNGSIEYKLNLTGGKVANMNCLKKRTVWLHQEDNIIK